ncbi:hypothetical protein H632_c4985p0, partial [Helicosporidium sp. ATCC 50920]
DDLGRKVFGRQWDSMRAKQDGQEAGSEAEEESGEEESGEEDGRASGVPVGWSGNGLGSESEGEEAEAEDGEGEEAEDGEEGEGRGTASFAPALQDPKAALQRALVQARRTIEAERHSSLQEKPTEAEEDSEEEAEQALSSAKKRRLPLQTFSEPRVVHFASRPSDLAAQRLALPVAGHEQEVMEA